MKNNEKGLRHRLHRQLEPSAWEGEGLSPANRLVAVLIALAGVVAVLETEPTLYRPFTSLFLGVELCFALAFSVEYLARVYAAGEEARYRGMGGRLRYMTTPSALIDLIAILPSLLVLNMQNVQLLRLFRVLRLLRVARLGRLTTAWDALGVALHRRRFELTLSFIAASLLLVLSSAVLYLVEAPHQPEAFGSIPRALWWSVATLTTVGYGDVTPITPLGRVFAGITALAGIGLIAMPTGILAAAFSDAFQHPPEEDEGQGKR